MVILDHWICFNSLLNVPVLGVGAVGLAAAYEVYKKEMRAATAPAGAASSLGDLEDE